MNANTKKKLSDNMIWLVLVVLVIIMSIANPKFFTIANLRTLLTGESIKGIMAFGVAFAILTKGIDLSIGASAALIACVTGALVQRQRKRWQTSAYRCRPSQRSCLVW